MPDLPRAHVEEAGWRPCHRYAFYLAHLPHPHLALPIQRIDRHDGDDRQDDQAQHPRPPPHPGTAQQRRRRRHGAQAAHDSVAPS